MCEIDYEKIKVNKEEIPGHTGPYQYQYNRNSPQPTLKSGL